MKPLERESERLWASVVVPSYEGAERLRRLLPELLSQDLEAERYEVIVVDDGSAAPLEAELAGAFAVSSRLRWLRKPNGGGASARNLGAQHARGRILLFIDDDMRVSSDFLRAHVEAQLEVGPAAISAYYRTELEGREVPFVEWYVARSEEWQRASNEQASEVAPGLFEGHPILLSSTNVSIPRRLFADVGGFDEGYSRPGVEDMDLGLRLGRVGARVFRMNRVHPVNAEPRATLEQICERQRTGAALTLRLMRCHPEVWPDFEESPLASVNGALSWNRDPWALSARKIAKSLFFLAPFRRALFGFVAVLERAAPRTRLLPRLYDALIGIYTQRGWREGMRAELERSARPA
jgi:glycosyltransferase involved in cell wall biosynthesis